MSGNIEHGPCSMCKKETHVSRKYYHYDIICTCCNGEKDDHFEIVWYCKDCEPKPPRRVSAVIEPKQCEGFIHHLCKHFQLFGGCEHCRINKFEARDKHPLD